MDMKEILKFQMMSSLGGMMITQPGSHHAQHQKAVTGLAQMVWQILLWLIMSISDDVMKGLPVVLGWVKTSIQDLIPQRVRKSIHDVGNIQHILGDNAISLSTRHFINELEMTRVFQTEKGSNSGGTSSSANAGAGYEESNGMVDAVLAQISRLHNVPSFSLIKGGQIMINFKEKPIQLTKDVFVKIDSLTTSTEGDIAAVRITLQSNTFSAAEIAAYVKTLYTNYLQELKNSLGNNIYFFDQKSRDAAPPAMPTSGSGQDAVLNHKRMLISTAPKQLSFTMSPFYSNKQFDNIYGDQIRTIEQRVKFFVDNKAWYDKKGIPYQLGLLLSGVPGCGKTSVIRAVANYTRRHIVNVNFANITTATQLKNLFFNDKIQVFTDQSMSNVQTYHIPIDQRLYVLEEIDAIGDIVRQRTAEGAAASSLAVNDELNLGEILTVLDGTMEILGRMLIMTTNHPEFLDSALIRPGRIDVRVHFGYAPAALVAEMYEGYLDRPFDKRRINELPDRALSPAEVGQVLFKHFDRLLSTSTDTGKDDILIDTVIQDLHLAAKDRLPAVTHTLFPAPTAESTMLDPLTRTEHLPPLEQHKDVEPELYLAHDDRQSHKKVLESPMLVEPNIVDSKPVTNNDLVVDGYQVSTVENELRELCNALGKLEPSLTEIVQNMHSELSRLSLNDVRQMKDRIMLSLRLKPPTDYSNIIQGCISEAILTNSPFSVPPTLGTADDFSTSLHCSLIS